MSWKRQFIACIIATIILLACMGEARAGVMDDLRFKNGMVYGLTDIDQRTCHFCSGNLFGLNDKDGRIILPTTYSDIDYCGHGIFLATETRKQNKYYFGDKRHFFNRDGVESTFVIPNGAFLFNILSFGSEADVNPDLILNNLPSDTILHFGYPESDGPVLNGLRQGLCDLQGKVLLEPFRGSIFFNQPGQALIVRNSGLRELVDLKTWTKTQTNLTPSPGVCPKPRIPASSNFSESMPFPKDRVRILVSTDNGKFDLAYWNDFRTYPVPAIDMFNRFLHDYDLIGMSRERVEELLLGARKTRNHAVDSETVSISFPSVSCIPWVVGVKFKFHKDRVLNWFFFEGDPVADKWNESEPITTNVVLQRPFVRGRILAARIGESGSGVGTFPNVVPKEEIFSSQQWKDEVTKKVIGIDRRKQGYYLLRDYELVGMTRAQTEELLGAGQVSREEPSIIFYDVFSGDCGNAGSDNLELWFEKGVVVKWRVARHEFPSSKGPSEPWIRTREEKKQYLQYCLAK